MYIYPLLLVGQFLKNLDNYELNDIFSRYQYLHIAFHFHRLAKYYSNAHYGQGSGPIMMDDVNCVGTELDIADCTFLGWVITGCSHVEDIGVSCGVYTV